MNSSLPAIQYYESIEKNIEEDVHILNAIVRDSNEELEGNCFYHGVKPGENLLTSWYFKYKRINFAYLIKNRKCKKILEIGVNAGHSAAVFLNALPSGGEMITFDLCDHKYTIPCVNYLTSKHSQFKYLYVGDSRETLKGYVLTYGAQKETFDLIHIDGGHSADILASDLMWGDLLLKSGGILILDDTQLNEMQRFIPTILEKGYVFVMQIPTFGFMHTIFEKL